MKKKSHERKGDDAVRYVAVIFGICVAILICGRAIVVLPQDAPEVITLDTLSKRYEPVTFPHMLHVDVIESCEECHHAPSGEISACSECHTTPLDPENRSKLGLKGAYHLQCVGCHQDSQSGPTRCADCHQRKDVKSIGTRKLEAR